MDIMDISACKKKTKNEIEKNKGEVSEVSFHDQ